jgi:hypothetical protein
MVGFIMSNLGPGGNNFEVVCRALGGGLQHWTRENNPVGPWVPRRSFASGVTNPDQPALIQSNLGPRRNNFEVVVHVGDSLQHWYRNNDQPDEPWFLGDTFARNRVNPTGLCSPALIQSNMGPRRNNFEVVFLDNSRNLQHWYRDNDNPALQWYYGGTFAPNVQNQPRLIQSNLAGNNTFEVIVPGANGLQHWSRDNNNAPYLWSQTATFGANAFGLSPIIQSNLGPRGGNFEVVVPIRPFPDLPSRRYLQYWTRVNGNSSYWVQGPTFGGPDAPYSPALIQSNLTINGAVGNFEVVGEASRGDRPLRHWFCDNNDPNRPWNRTQ